MRRAIALGAAVLGLGLAAGGAQADDAPSFAAMAARVTLPSQTVPNAVGLAVPAAWLAPPAQPQQLSYDELLGLWKQAGVAYGVPWNVLAAINKVESDFGRNMGPSSAGAVGWMQFMPDTWLRWGIDADGDGIADPWNPVDAINSAARYLAACGAATDIRAAVYSYNHADWYVNEVLQLAQLYGSSDAAPTGTAQTATPTGTAQTAAPAAQPVAAPASAPSQPAADTIVFTLDSLGQRLAAAKQAVAEAASALRAARDHAGSLADGASALDRQAESAPLLSDRLDAQRHAAQAGADAASAQEEVDRLQEELAAARTALAELEQQAAGASFNRAAADILAAPQTSAAEGGRWVFPVGGGPAVVSVSHVHHDYPAADIAAPDGSPLYALADGTVLYAWSADARCGAGFTMQTFDGQTWTYCHLSALDPAVAPGARLAAGDPVGLVGETGDATVPHLHLQLQPAAGYPQAESWFASLAGAAFRWSDESAQPAPAQQ